MQVDEEHAQGPRRLLQAHFLWNFVIPVHGVHAFARLCEQVRLLLEAPQESSGNGMALADRRARAPCERLHEQP